MAKEKKKPTKEELDEIFECRDGIKTSQKINIVLKYKYLSDIKKELKKLKESN